MITNKIANRIQLLCAKPKIPVNRINNNAELATVPIKIQGLTIIVVPLVTGVTYAMTGKHEEGAPGWFAFLV